MTGLEWEDLTNLLAVVQKAAYDVCEFIDGHMKTEIKDGLCKAGVPDYVEDAYHDVQVNVRRNMCQLEEVDFFEPWLARIVMSTAKKYRPRYPRLPKPIQHTQQMAERPRELGAKTITIDGKPHVVRVFEPTVPQEEPSQRRPLVEPVTDGVLAKASVSNRPNYPFKTDVWEAIAKLPPRWALAILLVYVLGFSAAEAAQIIGCSRARIFKLVDKGKVRMRELLPGYGRNDKPNPESRSRNGKRRARTIRALPVSDALPRGSTIPAVCSYKPSGEPRAGSQDGC